MRYRLLLCVSIAALTVAAWIALWAMGSAAHASMHHHHHHGAASGGAAPIPMMLGFVGGWTLMTIAMMLPTSLPVLSTLATLARDRADRTRLVALAVIGYLLTWTAFGVIVWAGQQALPRLALGGSLILLMAGVYQFTPLKHRCLDKCRSPLSFVVEHWQGRHDRWQAFRLGIDHGLFCVGCCWTLMLLMFVVGMSSLAWMFALGIVMAIEKNTKAGRRLSAPIGVVLLAWGAVTLVSF
jgi:predicted metal-binding membrane protein